MFRKMALETLGCFGRKATGLRELGADTKPESWRWEGARLPPSKPLPRFCSGLQKEKKKPRMLIFLVPTHSLTMNRNMIEIFTRHQSRLPFKANAKGLRTHSSWNNVCKNRVGLKQRTKGNRCPRTSSRGGVRACPPPVPSPERWPSYLKGIAHTWYRWRGPAGAWLAPEPLLSSGSLGYLPNQSDIQGDDLQGHAGMD